MNKWMNICWFYLKWNRWQATENFYHLYKTYTWILENKLAISLMVDTNSTISSWRMFHSYKDLHHLANWPLKGFTRDIIPAPFCWSSIQDNTTLIRTTGFTLVPESERGEKRWGCVFKQWEGLERARKKAGVELCGSQGRYAQIILPHFSWSFFLHLCLWPSLENCAYITQHCVILLH